MENTIEIAPHRGALAICSNGSLGLITSNTKVPVPFPEQPDYQGWTGIQVSPSRIGKEKNGRVIGDTWCSSNPTVIFSAEQLRVYAELGLLKRNTEKAHKLIETVRALHTPDVELVEGNRFTFDGPNGVITGKYVGKHIVKGVEFDFFELSPETTSFFLPSEIKNLKRA